MFFHQGRVSAAGKVFTIRQIQTQLYSKSRKSCCNQFRLYFIYHHKYISRRRSREEEFVEVISEVGSEAGQLGGQDEVSRWLSVTTSPRIPFHHHFLYPLILFSFCLVGCIDRYKYYKRALWIMWTIVAICVIVGLASWDTKCPSVDQNNHTIKYHHNIHSLLRLFARLSILCLCPSDSAAAASTGASMTLH